MTTLADFKRLEGVVERTPEEKIAFVESELASVIKGERKLMACPFCQGLNHQPGENDETEPVFCCRLFAITITAAFQKVINQDLKDMANRISDKVHG